MFEDPLLPKVVAARELIDEITGGLSPDTSGSEALELLEELAAIGRQVELAQCRTAERVDRSGVWAADATAASSTAFLKRELGETASWVNTRVRLGRALTDELPATRAEWEAGRIGMQHANEIARAVEHLDPDLTAEMDTVLAQTAPAVTLTDLRSLAEHIRQQADPERSAKKDREDFERQRFTLAQTTGGYRLTGWVNTETGAIITNALEHFTAKPPSPATAADTGERVLSAETRRALGLLEMARQAVGHQECESTGAPRPTVVVTLPYDDLRCAHGAADIEGSSAIPAAAAKRLACDADTMLLRLGADGAVLDMGRRTRTATPSQRIALAHRDKGCAFHGCDAKPNWCQAHHLIWWRDQGTTDIDNLVLLCHRHHHLLHEGGWTWTRGPDQRPRFHPPDAGYDGSSSPWIRAVEYPDDAGLLE